MPWTESKAVPEGNCPFPHNDDKSGGLTMDETFRIAAEELGKNIDIWTSPFDQTKVRKQEEQE